MALKPTAAIKSNKLGQIVTPAGSALFVSCPNASQYDEEKQEASIILTQDDYKVFKASLDKLIASYDGELVVDTSSMDMPVKDATDKEGNPDGNVIVKAKTAMKYPAKLYNAKGTPIVPTPGFSVSNRSKIKLSVSAELVSTKVYKGLVLRLNGIQIISSTPWGGNNPFSAEDGDFTGDEGFGASTTGDDDWA